MKQGQKTWFSVRPAWMMLRHGKLTEFG